MADTYVDRDFGTGALKITPGHDPNDFEIGQRLGLPVINVMNNDGTFNANAGRFDGVERSEVRKQLWADLKVGWPRASPDSYDVLMVSGEDHTRPDSTLGLSRVNLSFTLRLSLSFSQP